MDEHVHDELTEVFVQLTAGRTPLGEQDGREEDQRREADEGHRDADARDLEHAERSLSRCLQQPGDHEVRRRADGRDDASEYRGEREGHQVAGGGLAPSLGPVRDLGHEHGHDRRVVEEGRRGGGRKDEPQEGAPGAAVPAERCGDERLERAGLLDRAGQDVERADGDGRRVAEAGERLLRGHDPEDQQQHDGTEDRQRWRRELPRERHEGQQEDDERDRDVEAHQALSRPALFVRGA